MLYAPLDGFIEKAEARVMNSIHPTVMAARPTAAGGTACDLAALAMAGGDSASAMAQAGGEATGATTRCGGDGDADRRRRWRCRVTAQTSRDRDRLVFNRDGQQVE